jgi:hypothetical protein
MVGAVGGERSMVHVLAAGEVSVWPPAVEATLKVCEPASRPEYVFGLVQELAGALSREQLNVGDCPVEWKVKVAAVLLVRTLGLLSMSVSAGFAALAGAAVASRNAPTRAGIPSIRDARRSWRV